MCNSDGEIFMPAMEFDGGIRRSGKIRKQKRISASVGGYPFSLLASVS
jgi:hypothetical protein